VTVETQHRTGVPEYDFNVNTVLPLGGHWAMVDEKQDEHPYFWTTYAAGHWVLTDPAAIREAYADYATFSSISEVAADPEPNYTFIPTNLDPPEHVKYRQTMNAWFSPGAIEKVAPSATKIAIDLVDGVAAEGRCDFMTAFASPYPTTVFLHTLGLPLEDTTRFAGWVREIFDNLRHPDNHDTLERAMGHVRAYWSALIDDRRARSRDVQTDFVTHLINQEVNGHAMTDEEILNISVVIMMAGIETTTGQLGFMFEHLARNPDLQRRIVEDPDVIPSAVEEFLRIHTIVLPGRKVTRDVEFHGCPMRKGDMVMLTTPAANRSPEVFDCAREVDIDRAPNRHIAFGSGPHRCLGLHLARRELATALRVWHERIPTYELGTGDQLYERGGTLSPVSVPLQWRNR
jgi:cytochrome P450